MATAYLCDFDGTVSPHDIGASLVRRYTRGREHELHQALARWKAGEIGHRELTEMECRGMTVTREEALGFTVGFSLDPEFAPFARAARARGDRVMVVSEGFDFYIEQQLDAAGLGEIPWAANHARFEGESLVPEFPHHDPSCRVCGNCKGRHVRAQQAEGRRVVFVGDGLSDRCGARAADVVVARDALLDWCRAQGIAAHRFDGFAALAGAVAA
jgi:2-hydroxy-3-keto-5-methylthiopentenyl-1-phosphate phosphatase